MPDIKTLPALAKAAIAKPTGFTNKPMSKKFTGNWILNQHWTIFEGWREVETVSFLAHTCIGRYWILNHKRMCQPVIINTLVFTKLQTGIRLD